MYPDYSYREDDVRKLVESIESQPFRLIKNVELDAEQTFAAADAFVQDMAKVMRARCGSSEWTLTEGRSSEEGKVEAFLYELFSRVVPRCAALTCVVEFMHDDDVYLDLYSKHYAGEYFSSSKYCVRISLFEADLDEHSFFLRPGDSEPWEDDVMPLRSMEGDEVDQDKEGTSNDKSAHLKCPLSKDFVGCVVLLPRCGGVVGRTLLNPAWVVRGDAYLRLSDFGVTVRGKRLSVPCFPYRQQDSEVLSCAELTVLNMVCYYSNEYNEYPVTMPEQVVSEVARSAAVRVTPSVGLRYGDVGRVLRKVGFHPRRYDVQSMLGAGTDQYGRDGTLQLEHLLRTFMDSGIPVAVNVQQPLKLQNKGVSPDATKDGGGDTSDEDNRNLLQSPGVGHSLIAIGLGPSTTYDEACVHAENKKEIVGVVSGGGDESTGTISLVDVADIETGRAFSVIDDSLIPYAFRKWPKLSGYRDLTAEEIMVPLTRDMALDALDARNLAWEVLSSTRFGLAVCLGDAGEGEGTFVLTQQMVSTRGYQRYRVVTCDEDVAFLYESGTYPRYMWLFEVFPLEEWKKPWRDRTAIGEVAFDATSVSSDPLQVLVFLRLPRLLYYHGPDGSSWSREDPGYPSGFKPYLRNLRNVEPRAASLSGGDAADSGVSAT